MVQLYELETKLNGQEDIEQYHSLVEILGLKGQSKVIVDKKKSPVPYKWLNRQQIEVIKTICPIRVEVDEYSKEPIPIEVLEHLKICTDNQYFTNYKIAYTDTDPDPFLIGFLGGYYYEGGTWKDNDKKLIVTIEDYNYAKSNKWSVMAQEEYAIARLGSEAESWESLTERARAIYIKTESKEAEQRIRDAQRTLEDLEKVAFDRFN